MSTKTAKDGAGVAAVRQKFEQAFRRRKGRG